jgi:hypothetical protein
VIDDQPRRTQSPQRDENEEFRTLVFFVPFVVKGLFGGIQGLTTKDTKITKLWKTRNWPLGVLRALCGEKLFRRYSGINHQGHKDHEVTE